MCALSGRLKNGPVLGICAVPHLLCILTSVWYGVLPAGTASALRFAGFPLNLFGGCFYFALGKAIAENRSALTEKWNRKKAACGFLLCCALFALEILAAKKADPQADTGAWEAEIDFLVYKLYGLSYDEVLVVDPGTGITREEYDNFN